MHPQAPSVVWNRNARSGWRQVSIKRSSSSGTDGSIARTDCGTACMRFIRSVMALSLPFDVMVADEHVVENQAECVDVGTMIGVFASCLLGRHVIKIANDPMGEGGCGRRARRGGRCRNP